MERRDWSLEAVQKLIYAHSLDSFEKAKALSSWCEDYLQENSIEDFDLELDKLQLLEELLFRSVDFLKKHKEDTRKELINIQKMQKFLGHQ